jgi:hypothetical protein
MTHRFLFVAAALTLASAAPRTSSSQAVPDKPAPAPPAAPPAVPPTTPPATPDSAKDVDPVGTYTVYLTAQGNAMTTVNGDGIPPLPVNSVTVAGNKVTLSLTAPDGTEAVIAMVITGDDITGQWSMANDGSSITGKKTP